VPLTELAHRERKCLKEREYVGVIPRMSSGAWPEKSLEGFDFGGCIEFGPIFFMFEPVKSSNYAHT